MGSGGDYSLTIHCPTDHFVENVILKDVTKTFATNEIRKQAQGIFKEEWERLSVDGKVEEVDAVFLAVARKCGCISSSVRVRS